MSRNPLIGIAKRALAEARARDMKRVVRQIERARVLSRALSQARSVPLDEGYPLPLDGLRDTLGELGIGRGDLVHVQSSLSHLLRGSAEKTAESRLSPVTYAARAIDVLLDVIGPEGTLMMNTDSLSQDQARRAWAGLTDPNVPIFDFRTSPTRRGLIAELFRRRTGVIRSVHPWYNMAALGPLANDLMAEHERSAPYAMDEHSPVYKLTTLGGKVVLLGQSFIGNAPIHLVEYLYPDEFPRPVYLNRPIAMTYVARDGSVQSIEVMLHAWAWYVGGDETMLFCEHLDRTYGFYRRRKFRRDVEIIAYDAKDQYEATLAAMKANVTLYDPAFRS